MIASQQIARQVAAAMELYDEVEALGYFAAVCDVTAWAPDLNERERRGLEARAAKYRKLQIETLAKLPAPEREEAKQ